MIEIMAWVVVVVLAILVLTGTISGTLLAWFVIGGFAFVVLCELLNALTS